MRPIVGLDGVGRMIFSKNDTLASFGWSSFPDDDPAFLCPIIFRDPFEHHVSYMYSQRIRDHTDRVFGTV